MTLAACEWPVDYTECGPCPSLGDKDSEDSAKFESMAVEYLWRYTERQFGLCEGTLRPCRQDCTEGISTYGTGPGGSPWQPTLIGGQWYNIGCGGACRDKCGCSSGRAMMFDKPVFEIVSVQVDGEVLPSGSYRLDEYQLLVRQDGQRWPYCQDMGKPLGESDTWAVTFRVGAPVPIGGQIAAAKLACEFAKAACGDNSCQLPQRWQTVSRQGVTISAALDTFEGLEDGKTGIWLIDAWVASVTKGSDASMGISIASPDYSGAGRRTT